jgi:ATP-dependent helicase/nuclease subunit A
MSAAPIHDALASAGQNQRAAADPRANVFVTANAGSGKTKVLIDRIARLLLEGSPPSAFLCITFTKAAAAEMQRRLFDRLGGWSVADDAKLAADLSELLGAKPSARMLANARGLFAQALETPGGLRIQTIHAFCERLLRRFPLEAGIAAGFRVGDDREAKALLEQAWTAALAQAGPAAALRRFARRLDDKDLDKFFAALPAARRAFTAQRDFDLATAQALRDVTALEGAYRAEILDGAPWDDLGAAIERLLGSDNKSDRDLAEEIARLRADPAQRDLDRYFSLFLTDKFAPYARKPTPKMRAGDAFIDRLFSASGETGRVLRLRAQMIAAARAEDAAAANDLAQAINHAFAQLKRSRGLLDFDDLIAAAHSLLAEQVAASWVLYKLDGGIDHILIDEGQDTSPLQWALLAPLQEEFFAGGGARAELRTVFAVGDPKQSIYGFQGADPRGFLAQSQALSSRAAGAERKYVAPELKMSFRSAPEILTAVDAVFGDANPSSGAPDEFDKVAHIARRADEAGRVEWWPLALRPDKVDAEPWMAPLDYQNSASAPAELARILAQTVAGWIAAGEAVWDKGVLRPMHAGDVLVLVRQRGPLFQQLSIAFKRAGLAVAGADRLVLRDDHAVRDLTAVMQFGLDPRDDYALACVLKGPFLGLTDDAADLAPLAYGRGDGEALIDRLMAQDDPKYAAAQAFAARARRLSGGDPFGFLSDLLERCDDQGRSGWRLIFERLGPETRDPIEELLARALAASSEGCATVQHFLTVIEADAREVKREMEGAGEAVRIMTVHGAKGLEAPVVILPDTVAAAEVKRSEALFFSETGPIVSFSKKDDDALAGGARAQTLAAAQAEHRRLLYVAMTRARDRLIVCGAQSGTAQAGREPGCWHETVEAALGAMGARFETPTGPGYALGPALRAVATAPAQAAMTVTPPAWLEAPAPLETRAPVQAPSHLAAYRPAGLSIGGDGSARFRRGRLIHALLQRLPDLPAPDRRAAGLNWLARQSVPHAAAEALLGEALGVIDDPAFAEAFGPMSRAEAPIIGGAPGLNGFVRGVVDRLAITASDILVIDFKTDRPAPADPADVGDLYLAQLAAYRAVLAAAFPGRRVRAGLIWTEAPRLMELPSALLDRFASL